jgi:Icc-related predicted phosphoesterase
MVIDGIHFWGSPRQPECGSWAFGLNRFGRELHEVWDRIPLRTDVVITHGPPYGFRDTTMAGEHVGGEELAIRLAEVEPRLHAFGHIHCGYGIVGNAHSMFVNSAVCDKHGNPTKNPIVVEIQTFSGRWIKRMPI